MNKILPDILLIHFAAPETFPSREEIFKRHGLFEQTIFMSTPPRDFDRWLSAQITEEFGLVHKLYEWYKLLHADVILFPKTERYTLGERLKMQALELIDGVWRANGLPLSERLVLLEQLQRTIDLSKLLVRLAHELGIYKTNGYLYRQERLQEIGRMLGAWRKNTRKKLGLDP